MSRRTLYEDGSSAEKAPFVLENEPQWMQPEGAASHAVTRPLLWHSPCSLVNEREHYAAHKAEGETV